MVSSDYLPHTYKLLLLFDAIYSHPGGHLRGGRGDALYKSTVDIDIDILNFPL